MFSWRSCRRRETSLAIVFSTRIASAPSQQPQIAACAARTRPCCGGECQSERFCSSPSEHLKDLIATNSPVVCAEEQCVWKRLCLGRLLRKRRFPREEARTFEQALSTTP